MKTNEKELHDLSKQLRAEYQKRWRLQNRDKVKSAQERYWLRRAEKLLQEQQGGEKVEN